MLNAFVLFNMLNSNYPTGAVCYKSDKLGKAEPIYSHLTSISRDEVFEFLEYALSETIIHIG